MYELVASTDAQALPTTVRPDDYDAILNPRAWKLRFTGGPGLMPTLYTFVDFDSNGDPPTDGSILTQGVWDNISDQKYINKNWPNTDDPDWKAA
jgi:hypothetical protein